MFNVNNPSNFNTPFTPKAASRKLSPAIIGGGLVLALIGGMGSLAGNAHGHQPAPSAMTSQYNSDRPSENGETEPNNGDAVDQDAPENGYVYTPQGSNYSSPSDQTPSCQTPSYSAPGTESSDSTDDGYAAREKAQDQSAQAFDGYIRDTDTVRDTENGQVYTDVPNDQADSAIQSGAATEVPTAELPTSGDSSAAGTPDTSASDAPAAE